MYKIYINQVPLILSKEPIGERNENQLISRYPGKSRYILNYVDSLEKKIQYKYINIYSQDLEQLWDDFSNLYKIIHAGGGLVYNSSGEILAIYRMDFWDLPKGKIEKGESLQQGAQREVEEETGIQLDDVAPEAFITTYHTYKNKKGTRILKVSHWFEMQSSTQKLIPQEEEGIEIVKWVDPEAFLKQNKPVYKNIEDVVLKALDTPLP